MSIVVYFKARFPHKAMNGMAPKQAWSRKKLSMNQLKVLGCVMYTQRLNNKKIKLDAKSIQCVFVRYNLNSKAYKFIEESIRKLIIISDVVFNEVMKKKSLTRKIVRTPKVGNKLVNLEHENE